MIRGKVGVLLASTAVVLACGSAAAKCFDTTVIYESGDFILSFDQWRNPDDEVGELRHRPTGKRLEVFSIYLGTNGKTGTWGLSIAERYCRDRDDCTLEGDVEVVQPGDGREPPKELRVLDLSKMMDTYLRPGFWPGGARPDERFVLKECRPLR